MKIFGITGNYADSLSEKESGLTESGINWFVMTDGSLLNSGKPYFIPNPEDKYCCYPSLAVKICKLGKNIPVRFAHRYYEEITCGLNIRNEILLAGLKARGLPWDAAVAVDYSAPVGRFVSKPAFPGSAINLEVAQGNDIVFNWNSAQLIIGIDEVISLISFDNTLRTGDIIMVGFPEKGIPLEINRHISVSADGVSLLLTKIK